MDGYVKRPDRFAIANNQPPPEHTLPIVFLVAVREQMAENVVNVTC
jgi:hypothetical protein